MSDELIHLNRVHADGHSKYVYFLLAATGAALGYALQKLDGSTPDWVVWLGLGAISSWLLSFLLGCKHVMSIQSAIETNFQLLQFTDGSHPQQPSSPEELAIAWAAGNEALTSQNKRAKAFFDWQFRLLSLGVLLFTAWRVLILFGAAGPAH
ncbi:hypothetical protein [Pseudoxanthomonas sp. UTMC 1351]|uniref:hypothetical protein n=1 Tax=Pseudoxanthomonas sp. UTMC 1351 TaxID=2695853 RepID=UPI0034CD7D3B